MNERIENEAEVRDAKDELLVQLGQWMGRREAFGLMAGRCSAADIEILCRIREEKLYASVNCTWDEFCARHLHVTRRTVDREIGHLREFGPAFFTIRQLTHVQVKDYHCIAPYVTEQGVNVDGKVVALLPENSAPLAAAVEELVKRGGSGKRAAAPAAFDIVLKRCQAAGRALRSYGEKLNVEQRDALVKEAIEIRNAAEALGARFIDVRLEIRP